MDDRTGRGRALRRLGWWAVRRRRLVLLCSLAAAVVAGERMSKLNPVLLSNSSPWRSCV